MNNFVHLHVHTEYSLLDGASRIDKLMDRCIELGMTSIAITDHGVMYGAVEFFKSAKKKGIKPIIGCEVYVAARTMLDKEPGKDNSSYHLVLLAKNETGYKNLIKMVSAAFTEGFYYKPRVDIELLKKNSEGIIALSGCIAGNVAQLLLKNDYNAAKDLALEYKEIFGEDNYFIEIQDHGIEEQKRINPQLLRLSQETGIKLIATNDVHYVREEDAKAQDVLLCIQTGSNFDDENRMRFNGEEFYLKSADEMLELFPYAPEAIANSNYIAEKCNFEFEFGNIHLPQYDVPEGFNSNSYLRHITMERLPILYDDITEEIQKRVEYELDTITTMGYADYYLIVWDYVIYAKKNGIVVGPGRGSGAGSIVAYLISITDIDPIKYKLVFERFLNPERISMPDFDIDFCYERRQEIIDYVIGKYGKERVAQIVTFNTMAARGAIRDVGRVLRVSLPEVDQIAKMIPTDIGMTISKALEINKELKNVYETNSEMKKMIDTAIKLEGTPRNTGTHAAGVVISKNAVSDYVPLQTNADVVTTQFTMGNLEELGLLKMDFLGLRTLTVIRDALILIEKTGVIIENINKIDLEDKEVYKLIASGDTYGIFQLESLGMTSFMKELKPKNIEDIIAGISMYRPGPMDQIPRYIDNRNNPEKVTYLHPKLEEILDVTSGVIIYQEQVMQIVRDLGGYSMGRSDLVRRAMSKKKADVMAMERENFINGIVDNDGKILVAGCVRNGINPKIAGQIYDELVEFAKYGFNKAHAAAYAVIGYQTAWLKYHYPVEFSAALISSVMDQINKVGVYVQECKKHKINVLPPDINESSKKFSVVDNKIRFGLAAVKNVGEGAIEAIIEARETQGQFTSLQDFFEKVDLSQLNKRAIESLIKCGAFDCLGKYRSQLLAVYDKMMDSINAQNKKNLSGQFNLFDMVKEDIVGFDINIYPDMEEMSMKDKLSMEKEMLGLYISGHPLEDIKESLDKKSSIKTYEINIEKDDEAQYAQLMKKDETPVIMGGIVTQFKKKTTKRNEIMATFVLEDYYGTIEVIVFPRDYQKYSEILKEDEIIMVRGILSLKEDKPAQIKTQKITRADAIANKILYLKLDTQTKLEWDKIKTILQENRGKTSITIVEYNEYNEKKAYQVANDLFITVNDELVKQIGELIGVENIVYK